MISRIPHQTEKEHKQLRRHKVKQHKRKAKNIFIFISSDTGLANVLHFGPNTLLKGSQVKSFLHCETRDVYCRGKEAQITQKPHPVNTTGEDNNFECMDTIDMKCKLENLLTKQTEDLKNLWKTKEDCKNEIEKNWDELHNTLKKLKDNVLTNLDNYSIYHAEYINRQSKTLIGTLNRLNKDTQIHDQAKTHNLTESHAKCIINQEEYESVYKDIRQEDFTPQLVFRKNEMLDDLLKQVRTFGNIEVVKVTENGTSLHDLVDSDSIAVQH